MARKVQTLILRVEYEEDNAEGIKHKNPANWNWNWFLSKASDIDKSLKPFGKVIMSTKVENA
jgi:hypothetical protein